MRALGLFEGVGNISRAADSLGYDDHHLCEKEAYPRRVLARRFPEATITNDVCDLRGRDVGTVDLLHGGSPCQGFSVAGLGAALEDERSRLIFEFLRLVDECRPRVVLLENVAVLRSRGLHIVIEYLARAGYGCWWDCIPALAVGAPHLRDRLWLTAVRFDEFPDLPGDPMREPTIKMPRAGAMSPSRGLLVMEPQATIRACKQAMGAVKREDGTTWLTRLDSPLLSSGRHHEIATGVGRLWPTPVANDDNKSPEAHLAMKKRMGGGRKKITSLQVTVKAIEQGLIEDVPHQRMWPTASARDYKDAGLHEGAIGRGQLPEAVTDSLGVREIGLFPTPRANPRTFSHDSRPDRNVKAGQNLATEAARLWPTPASADAARGPGRSEFRDGGPNLRTAVAERDQPGPLSPYWCEWLMGMPIGWTDLEVDGPASLGWTSEYGIPRVLADVSYRKERLMAIGNSCLAQIAYLRIAQAHELLGIGGSDGEGRAGRTQEGARGGREEARQGGDPQGVRERIGLPSGVP